MKQAPVDLELAFLDYDGPCAVVTMNRPEKYNALSWDLRRDTYAALEIAIANPQVRGVILWGGTKSFIGGGDLVEMKEKQPLEMFGPTSGSPDLWALIQRASKPVIAAIAGPCFGGGLEVAMACDLRVAADNALMGQSEVNVGLIPGRGGTQRLTRLVGATRAKEMVFTGESIDAAEAYRIGLVNKVVPARLLLETAKQYVRRIAEKSPQSIQLAKLMIDSGQDMALESALTMEALAFANLFSTSDMKEGAEAFLQKRKPVFKGQ